MGRIVRPLLIAHRGDPAHLPENTLASFESAISKGAKAVEMDVRRLGDGTWVVFHDPDLRRATGSKARLSRMNGASLAGVEFRSHPILRLLEALRFCRKKGIPVYLDVKTPDHERQLLREIRHSGWLRRTSILAGNHATLARWRRVLPGRPVYWVTGYSQRVTARRVAQAQQLGLAGFVSYTGRVGRRAVERAHDAGLDLFIWTVRTRRGLRRFTRMGVDGIMNEIWPAPST